MKGRKVWRSFELKEFKARQRKVLKSMAEQGLDGLLMFNQESMYHLTGYDTFGFCFSSSAFSWMRTGASRCSPARPTCGSAAYLHHKDIRIRTGPRQSPNPPSNCATCSTASARAASGWVSRPTLTASRTSTAGRWRRR